MDGVALPQVQLTVSPLPALSDDDTLLCLFGGSPPHPARLQEGTVVCNSPSRSSLPRTPPGQGEAPAAARQAQAWGAHCDPRLPPPDRP